MTAPLLTRAALAASRGGSPRTAAATPTPPPPRLVHLGLGAFHRAHQAWYTARAADSADWGVVAFGGRAPRSTTADTDVPALLAAQDGLFTLVERGGAGDELTIVDSIVASHPGPRTDLLNAAVADARTAVVTLTVTEAGYRATPAGEIDLDDDGVRADLALLRAGFAAGVADGVTGATTTPGRLLAALEHRRRAGAGPIALVPCDNLPGNGALLRTSLLTLAQAAGSGVLADWITGEVAFVSTSVDRITPRAQDDLSALVERETGWRDAVPVVTEPFSDWVLAGDFPAGRPAWETSGARVLTDARALEAFENRKLWLLNGAHSLLAYAGLLAGRASVAEAVTDPALLAPVRAWWSEAARHLPAALHADAYAAQLLSRFRNHRVEHRLLQISADGSAKLRVRIVPVLLAETAAGREAVGAETAVAAWVAAHLRELPLVDAAGEAVAAARAAADPVGALLALVGLDDGALRDRAGLADRIRERVRVLVESARPVT